MEQIEVDNAVDMAVRALVEKFGGTILGENEYVDGNTVRATATLAAGILQGGRRYYGSKGQKYGTDYKDPVVFLKAVHDAEPDRFVTVGSIMYHMGISYDEKNSNAYAISKGQVLQAMVALVDNGQIEEGRTTDSQGKSQAGYKWVGPKDGEK